jgi:hypothetical protein
MRECTSLFPYTPVKTNTVGAEPAYGRCHRYRTSSAISRTRQLSGKADGGCRKQWS